jgi:hypothetical protein
MAQHKWHKEIKAWADGAEIETKHIESDVWLTDTDEPYFWLEDYEFRIKPQPKEPQYLYAYSTSNGIKFCGEGGIIAVTSPSEFIMKIGKIKLEDNDNGND